MRKRLRYWCCLCLFSSKTRCPQGTQPWAGREGEGAERAPTFQKMLQWLSDTYTSTGLAGIHPRVLSKLLREPTDPLPIIYQQSWLFREVPIGWTLASIPPIYREGRKIWSDLLWQGNLCFAWGKGFGCFFNWTLAKLIFFQCRHLEKWLLLAWTCTLFSG